MNLEIGMNPLKSKTSTLIRIFVTVYATISRCYIMQYLTWARLHVNANYTSKTWSKTTLTIAWSKLPWPEVPEYTGVVLSLDVDASGSAAGHGRSGFFGSAPSGVLQTNSKAPTRWPAPHNLFVVKNACALNLLRPETSVPNSMSPTERQNDWDLC